MPTDLDALPSGDPAHVDWNVYSEFSVVIAPGVPPKARRSIIASYTGTPRQRRRAAAQAEPFAGRVLAPERLNRLRNVPDLARLGYTVQVLVTRLLASPALQNGWLDGAIDGFAAEAAQWRLLTLLCEHHERVYQRGEAGDPGLLTYVESQVAALRVLVKAVYAVDAVLVLAGRRARTARDARPPATAPSTTDLSLAADRALALARHLHATLVQP
jgi:hypothetical protein